jgi:hexosaminidase
MRTAPFVPVALAAASLAAGAPNLMPAPARYEQREGKLVILQSFRIALTGYTEPRLESAARRMIDRLARQTGMLAIETLGGVTHDSANATLVVETGRASEPVQRPGEDESYQLTIDSKQARLRAPNPLGALHGMETFLQLIEQDRDGFAAPACFIDDKPRFSWRGLLIDVARHWQPREVLLRNLDAMAAVKLNVLHLHLTDDQGFRIESKRYPKLHEMGSDGHYYTQDQMREVIAYARDRGIRIVPEFDMPGHTTSWLVGYPELATLPGPYQIERKWGVHDPVLDPTKEEVYKFLDGFIGEMAALFPDQYFHIGGDEVNGKQWQQSAAIQTFMRERQLRNMHELQRYFNRRLFPIVTGHGKVMMGWDEILDPDLPKEILIQSWRGQKSLAEASRLGYAGILSAPYYLDLMRPAAFHYQADPIDENAAALTPEQRSRILGGEGCMWTEYVTSENIDGRIWPRMAAIAERFWSPREVRDVKSMYDRLEVVSRKLEWAGVRHRSNYERMLDRLAGGAAVEPVRILSQAVEQVRGYARGQTAEYTQFTPLNRLVDTAAPESMTAVRFSQAVDQKDWATARRMLERWSNNDAAVRPIIEGNPLLMDAAPVEKTVAEVAGIGLLAVNGITSGRGLSAEQVSDFQATLARARKAIGPLLVVIVDPVDALVRAAGNAANVRMK